ncbi:MAG TPA: hypothetical protein VH394_06020 [Thermoanaerobaculia bacterium]|jgi:hypothetical protein|nr:hypothetical protein [Thermoanaerobaculia bacterium]
MSAIRPDDPLPFDEGEYSVLQMPDSWHVLSLVFFAASLGARFLVALLPSGRGIFYRPILTAFSVPVLAGVGLFFGLVGLRRPETRNVARIAVFLNLIVLGLSALVIAAFYYILPG